jgi:CRP/FNR family cyclic AMP-dependent transcriptional regulator
MATIRQATKGDAAQWRELVEETFGKEYPAKEIYDLGWIEGQLDPSNGHETWVADADGELTCSISILKASDDNHNPVLNLGRNLHRRSSFSDGSAKALLKMMTEIAMQRNQMVVTRVAALDNLQQILYETAGFACVGFQPYKHMLQARTGMLYYVRSSNQVLMTRLPLSESLPQISELASVVLEKLKISNPVRIRDGATGYPLQHDIQVHLATFEDFQLWRDHCQSANPPTEISGAFNLGLGLMRVDATGTYQAVLGQQGETIVAGLAYYFDSVDRCVRLTEAFSVDDLSMGSLLQQAVKSIQEQFSPVYLEMDALVTSPRLLKTAEQLGFVPVAYLPAFYFKNETYADVVKMEKLNMAYALDGVDFTTESRAIAEVIDRNFQDQKVGVAIINLLGGLPIFDGLGDGELRKIARLFTQKLFRPGEVIFKKGDSGDEAYIVMRGQIDIQLEENAPPIASVPSGKIFGEMAFLDGAPRTAFAVASQASILLVAKRSEMNAVIQREPHLGMVVMKNVALDLSNKLRQANTAISGKR